MISISRCSTVALIALVLASGCSHGVSIKTVPVSGKVTLNDQPLSGATVTFVQDVPPGNTAPPPACSGVTGADGTYKLSTMASGRDVVAGAPPGNYKVIITKQSGGETGMGGDQGLTPEEMAKKMQSMTPEEMAKMSGGGQGAQPDDASAAAKSEIPARYGKADESGLTATVAASGAQTFDFPLKGD